MKMIQRTAILIFLFLVFLGRLPGQGCVLFVIPLAVIAMTFRTAFLDQLPCHFGVRIAVLALGEGGPGQQQAAQKAQEQKIMPCLQSAYWKTAPGGPIAPYHMHFSTR